MTAGSYVIRRLLFLVPQVIGVTTIVFILIVLGWFYLLALTILMGGVINALRLQ